MKAKIYVLGAKKWKRDDYSEFEWKNFCGMLLKDNINLSGDKAMYIAQIAIDSKGTVEIIDERK